MWLCEYCDAENGAGTKVCTDCGKEKAQKVKYEEEPSVFNKVKAAIIDKAQNEYDDDMCSMSINLKKWGKILFFACLAIGALAFVWNSISALVWLHGFESFRGDMDVFSTINTIIISFISALLWVVRGFLIKFAADALAIIVHSSHLNIESKTKEGE